MATLNWYVKTVECIAGEHIEPKPVEINLPAEYRWEVDTMTERLVNHPLAPFSEAERDAINAFATSVRAVPAAAPALTDKDWRTARILAQTLLPMLRSHGASLPSAR